MAVSEVLNIIYNPSCDKKCNKEKRKEIAENDLCSKVDSVLDGLPIRCVREHAVQKIHFLIQYFGIFATGMHKKWKDNINYIEICSGPGRCINRKNGDEFNGTALTILDHAAFKYLKKALFFDTDTIVIKALAERINSRNISNPDNLKMAQHGKFMELRTVFRELYRKNLEKIGYRYFEFNSVANFYDILFATSHERGIEFWEKATATRFDGQRKLL